VLFWIPCETTTVVVTIQANLEGPSNMNATYQPFVVDETAEPIESQYGEYLPTPREIEEACREIRASWSAREHRQRCVGRRQVLRRHLLQTPRSMRFEFA
jgi:hypothetical protein